MTEYLYGRRGNTKFENHWLTVMIVKHSALFLCVDYVSCFQTSSAK